MPTDRTIADRRFHHTDFVAADLAAAKRARGESISVVIPAKDEEATVGHVAATLRRALVDTVGLVDEILVVDGDSQDATVARAREAGVRVVRQRDVLPDAGSASGKGEALWKGLAASTGSIVVFVDADIHDIDAHFVTGLVGPLLTDAAVSFVKAAYDRPLRVGDHLAPTGGGRVTELVARPLLSSFWPELSWLAQPLSGEYAGRRSLLEAIPFVRGYGVELAMIVDIVDRAGVAVIAEVDLGRRVHEHQSLAALGRMATEILHVALARLAAEGRMVLTDPPATLLVQPVRDPAGGFDITATDVAPSERPPLADWFASR